MKNKIIVIFSSHLSNEENEKFKSHVSKSIGTSHSVYCIPNFNEYSLSEVYNKAIEDYSEEDAIMVFCHNDIIFNKNKWGFNLLKHFNNNDIQIIGVAGTTHIPESGRWWEDRTKMVGIVNHNDGVRTWASEYSNEFNGIRETTMVDGLFIAVDTSDVTHKFDEEFNGFHFYDMGFCFPNYLDGVNIGVITDIRITHMSIGQTNDQWELNRIQFTEKYKADLPIKHVSSESKLKVLICCQFFKNYTGSEVSNFELSRELVKQGCDVTLISSMVGEPLLSKAKRNGVKVYNLNNPPNYNVINNQLTFYKNEIDFDIIHINHKPIGEIVLQLYPNIPAVMHVRSEVIPVYEEPIINPNIKKYVSIRDSITKHILSFGGIDREDVVLIDNPFDTSRFNTNYKPQKYEKEVVLFVGTLDTLRRDILFDLKKMTKENNQKLWIIGSDVNGYAKNLADSHVTYFGIKQDVETYVKKCDYTAGIFKGRTTIEGYLCGKGGWIYTVNKQGNILTKELMDVPYDVEKYSAEYSAKKVIKLYNEVLNITT